MQQDQEHSFDHGDWTTIDPEFSLPIQAYTITSFSRPELNASAGLSSEQLAF